MIGDSHDHDGESSRSRLKTFVYLAVLAPVVLLVLLALNPSAAPTEEVYGEVLRLVTTPAGQKERLDLLVRLDSGEEVTVRIPDASLFRAAARVKIHKQSPRFGDGPVFRFRGYVDGGG